MKLSEKLRKSILGEAFTSDRMRKLFKLIDYNKSARYNPVGVEFGRQLSSMGIAMDKVTDDQVIGFKNFNDADNEMSTDDNIVVIAFIDASKYLDAQQYKMYKLYWKGKYFPIAICQNQKILKFNINWDDPRLKGSNRETTHPLTGQRYDKKRNDRATRSTYKKKTKNGFNYFEDPIDDPKRNNEPAGKREEMYFFINNLKDWNYDDLKSNSNAIICYGINVNKSIRIQNTLTFNDRKKNNLFQDYLQKTINQVNRYKETAQLLRNNKRQENKDVDYMDCLNQLNDMAERVKNLAQAVKKNPEKYDIKDIVVGPNNKNYEKILTPYWPRADFETVYEPTYHDKQVTIFDYMNAYTQAFENFSEKYLNGERVQSKDFFFNHAWNKIDLLLKKNGF